MRRGSFKRKLPRGWLGLSGSQYLLGVAVFSVILVSSLLYLFPHTSLSDSEPAASSQDKTLHVLSLANDDFADSSSPSDLSLSARSPPSESNSNSSYESGSSDNASPARTGASAFLLATVQIKDDLTEVCLENTGSDDLHQVQVTGQGRSLGTLSDLVPGEKKVLAVAGHQQYLAVSALDSADRMVKGRVEYLPSEDSTISYSTSPATSTAPAESAFPSDTSVPISGGDSLLTVKSAAGSQESPLKLNLSTNISEGRAGDYVGYRCIAKNAGAIELSDIEIHCAGKMASTKYLPSGEELILVGAFAIENCTALSATAQAKDGEGNIYNIDASQPIWMISSHLNLSVSAPRYVHRGENITMQILIENRGNSDLSNLQMEYGWGEVQKIGLLSAQSSKVLKKDIVAAENMSFNVSATAQSANAGGEVAYASCQAKIDVLSSALRIQANPSSVNFYPGDPVEVAWILSNTGEELLKNITIEGEGGPRILKELSPGQSVDMAAIYRKNSTSWINVTARASDSRGFSTTAEASVLAKAIAPGITLKLMPSEIETCPGEEARTDVLVTNSGDDSLQDVCLKLNGTTLSNLGDIEPGEFKVVTAETAISGNCSLNFLAEGRDSLGRMQSDEASAQVKAVVASLKIFAGASPATVKPGESCRISCTVANTGKVPIYSIFVISKRLGPLGNIDYLSPKRQMTVESEKKITDTLDDVVTAEGFTEDKKPVRAQFNLRIELLNGQAKESTTSLEASGRGQQYDLDIAPANISFGNVTFSFNLPEQEQTQSQVSGTMAEDIDSSAKQQNEGMLDRINSFLAYVERLLGLGEEEDEDGSETVGSDAGSFDGAQPTQSSNSKEPTVQQSAKTGASGSGNYELSIEGVKGSEHGAITILDVNAEPSQPAAGEPVNITVHIQCPQGVKSASVKYGLSDQPLTKQSMLNVDRVYDSPLTLESGDASEGYWSCTIPGRGAGVYMPLSVWIWDGSSSAEGGPYLMHWSTVNSVQTSSAETAVSEGSGMLFIESTSVKGTGEVSIKDSIQGSTMHFNEDLDGNGSFSLETMRCIDRSTSADNFTEKKDLVFTDGTLKGHQTVESPTFHGGLGASVTERYNLTHVDRSETASVSSKNSENNTLSFETDQAFNGTWNIETKYAKFYKKIKADQEYTGSFQTQKDIKFADAGQR